MNDFTKREPHKATISCKIYPASGPNGENAGCDIRLEGSTNDLLNAYNQLTQHLMRTLIETYGKPLAMGLYSKFQIEALKEAGIDAEAEAKEAERKRKILEGLESILGKTFTMPDEDGEEE